MNGYPSRSSTDGDITTQNNLGDASDDLSRDSVKRKRDYTGVIWLCDVMVSSQ